MKDAAYLRKLWGKGQAAVGSWSSIADPMVAEEIARAGWDFCLADFQHGFFGPADGPGVIQGYAAGGVAPIVRTAWKHPDGIMRALDLGACGVLVPMIDSAAEARAAVAAAKFPTEQYPDGIRSWGPPLWDVRPEVARKVDEANAASLVLVMIETRGAFAELEEIAAIEGVDGLYIGPNDLALTHGLGQTTYAESAELESMMMRIIEVADAVGKIAGMYCGSDEVAVEWLSRGVKLVNPWVDTAALAMSMRASLTAVRGAADEASRAPGY